MNARRIKAVARREGIEVLRDPRSLATVLLIPLFLLVLFGYALSLDVDEVPTIILDRDGTPESRDLAGRFIGSAYFSVLGCAASRDEVVEAIDHGRALMALVIPARFGHDLRAGRNVEVQAILDGSDANTASIALGYATGVVKGFSAEVRLARLSRHGAVSLPAPTEVRPRVWFNEELRGTNYIVPGLIAVILAVVGTFLTALTICRERERGTMEMLAASPLSVGEFLAGKVLPHFAAALTAAVIAALVGVLVFHVPFRGSVVHFVLSSGLFLMSMLGLGLLISMHASTQADAYQFAIVISYLPSFLLSGFVYSIKNMPRPIQLFTYLVPARYFVSIQESLFLKGTGMAVLWRPFLILALFAAGIWALAIRSVRMKLE